MNIELLKNCYKAYQSDLYTYNKMYEYYKGNTDAIKNYKMVTKRSNNKTPINYLKKLIKEEVSFSVGNDVNYISKSGNENIVNDIDLYLDHLSEGHNVNLAKNMLIYSKCYELYYLDQNKKRFNTKIISPLNGYVFQDDFGNVSFFMHIFKLKFDTKVYIDLYTDTEILHLNEQFEEIAPSQPHIFGRVPIGICKLSEEGVDDTLYKDIKGLQDAYETNLSDISNEISDFRNAYMVLTGIDIEEEDTEKMKEQGIMLIPDGKGTAQWLVKNINDTFIQNTLTTLEDKIYQISSHINGNDKVTSNTSSLALRSKLINLEMKCELNQKALADCIKTRLKFLFICLEKLKKASYDVRDIKIQFTPNVPSDDMLNAQIISQMGDKLSTETGLSLLSFIENPKNELSKLAKENEDNDYGENLLEGIDE